MAAFVVAPEAPTDTERAGTQLNIFPGSATPAVFAAGTPFWIGSGFVPAPESSDGGATPLDEGTRFELDIDGVPAQLSTALTRDGERTVGKLAIASFETGLTPGWHRFTGRWYVAGKLVLTSDPSIEFVEP